VISRPDQSPLTLEGVDRAAHKHPLESISCYHLEKLSAAHDEKEIFFSSCEEAGGSPPDPEHDHSSTHLYIAL
jgi:hypothetical protein